MTRPARSPARWPRLRALPWRRASAVALACYLLLRLLVTGPAYAALDRQHFGSDFSTFYQSARALREHRPAYAPAAGVFAPGPPTNLDLAHPAIVALIVPLVPLGPYGAIGAWLLVVAAGWALALALLVRGLAIPRTVWARPVALAAAAACPGFVWTLRMGQTGTLFACLALLAWLAARDGRRVRAAALLGALIALKFAFLPLAALVLAWRNPRAILAAGAGGAGVSLAALPFVGLAAYRDWLATLLAVAHYALPGNLSLAGVLWRASGGHLPRLVPLAILVAACALALAVATVPRWRDHLGADGVWAVLTALCLLGAPIAWEHYLPVALPLVVPPLLAWPRLWRGGRALYAAGLLPVLASWELEALTGAPVGTLACAGVLLLALGWVVSPAHLNSPRTG